MGYYSELGGKVNKYDNGSRMALLDACATVATFSMTSYQEKGLVGYNVYEDERIFISLDTRLPNVSVALSLGGEKYAVLTHSFGGITQVYRPGKWEKYIINFLFPIAEKKKVLEIHKTIADFVARSNRKLDNVEDSEMPVNY